MFREDKSDNCEYGIKGVFYVNQLMVIGILINSRCWAVTDMSYLVEARAVLLAGHGGELRRGEVELLAHLAPRPVVLDVGLAQRPLERALYLLLSL